MNATTLNQPPKTQSDRRNESERKLLDALVDIVLEDGVRAATSEAIGKRAGYSRGLAIARLGKREQMFATLIDRLVDDQMTQFQDLLTVDMSARDKLRTYVDVHFDNLKHSRGYRAYFVLVAGSLSDRELLRDAVIGATETVRRLLTQIIESGVQAGEFSDSINADAQVSIIGANIAGAGIAVNLLDDVPLDDLKTGAYAIVDAIPAAK